MFEALVITLREGVEAALVIGIIVTYLSRTGRVSLVRAVYAGLAVGVVASLGCAWLFASLRVSEEVYEGWLMIVGSLFVTSMVIWMARTARGLKRGIETRVESVAGGRSGAAAAGLFALTFVLVLREGVETVLFLAAVELNTDALAAFGGGLIGLAMAVGFGIAFIRGSVRVDIGRFFKVTEIVLIVLAVQLLIGGLHEFGEAGMIPIGREQMRLIGPIVKSDVLVIASLLALPLIILVIPGRKERSRLQAAMGMEGPDRRLALATMRREALWRRLLATAGIMVIAPLTLSFAFTRLPTGIDPPTLLDVAAGGEVRVPTAGLDDGHLHRFGVPLDGTVVRFIVMHNGTRLVPTFDACIVCGAFGYVESGGRLICLACAADINVATIGVSGGCNPIPLPYREEAGALVVAVDELMKEVESFREAEVTIAAPPSSD